MLNIDILLENFLTNTECASFRLIGHSGPVYACKFIDDTTYPFILSCSQDSTSILWSIYNQTSICQYKGHLGPVWTLSLPSNNRFFSTASADTTARLWCTESTSCIRIFSGHYSDVDIVDFHPNSSLLMTASSDRTSRIWDIRSGNSVRLFTRLIKTGTASCFLGYGKFLALSDGINDIHIYEICESKKLRTLQSLRGSSSIISLISSVDFKYLYCATKNGKLYFLDCVKILNNTNEQECFISCISTKASDFIALCSTRANCIMSIETSSYF